MEFDLPFSGEEILSGGLQGSQAMRLLSSIENQTAYLMAQVGEAINILLNTDTSPRLGSGYFQQLLQQATESITIHDLERYAPQWATLIAADPKVQAAVGHLLAQKYRFSYEAVPAIRQALSLDSQAVKQAYESQYHQPLATLFRIDEADEHTLKESEKEHKQNLLNIESLLSWVYLEKGDFLFRQGDVGDSLYVLIHGRLRVFLEDNERFELISEIGPGEILGEMALITAETRSATVMAARDATLFKLAKADFECLAERHPQVMMQIARIQAVRVRRLSNRRPPPPRLVTLAVIPISKEVPLADFCQRLVAAFSTYGETLHLNRARLDKELQTGAAQTEFDDPENSSVVAWLSEQEMRYRFVIYESDATPSAWTSRSIRQADQILLVGWAASSPELSQIEIKMLSEESQRATVRKSLVLLHEDASQAPVGTIKWLNARQVEHHHHLCWERDGDPSRRSRASFEYLSRFLTGNAIGVVLSGGGARGFAHIGVIRALQEAGIPIDVIGGNSMGAVISALFAMGWDYQTMLDKIRQMAKPLVIFDPTLPLVSLFAGRNRVKISQQYFGSTQIEDLWRPYFCVSSNLTHAELMIHRTGSLSKGVLASSTLAGIMPPIVHNGDLLVDGMLLNDMPIDVMYKQSNGGTVIAVNVSPPIDLERNSDYGPYLSGWRLLWNKINPFGKKLNVPNIATILQRAGELSSIYGRKELLNRNLADLYIEPPVEEVDLFDFAVIDTVAEIGYQFAKEKIAAWQNGQFKSDCHK